MDEVSAAAVRFGNLLTAAPDGRLAFAIIARQIWDGLAPIERI
jgi:hypothetical protein